MYDDQKEAWHLFSMNVEVCRNQHLMNMVGGGVRNPLLHSILAGVFTINLASLLDDALEEYIQANVMPGPHNRLFDRINMLGGAGRLKDAAALHDLRSRRNDLGHQPNEQGDWKQLDQDIGLVHSELHHLGILGPQEKYEFFYERSRVKDSPDHHIAFVVKHRFGVKKAGQEFMVMEQKNQHHRKTTGEG